MSKLEIVNVCDCANKLLILGFLNNYELADKNLKYPLEDVSDGQICIKKDIIVDNGWYDENGIYNTYYDIYSAYYPIEFCPICGKKFEYRKSNDNSLKLV